MVDAATLISLIAAGAATLLLLALIALEDYDHWEINPWICGCGAVAWLPVVAAGAVDSHLLGAAAGLAITSLIRRVRPAALGLGDIPLYTLCGWLVGITLMPVWAILNAGIAVILVTCLARKRGKPLRRCAIPAALAACPACLLTFPALWTLPAQPIVF